MILEEGEFKVPIDGCINREYKTMVKMVFFAQNVVKQWSWVLKQGDWLEMISIYLTLVWLEVLYKDPDSRNNEIFQANVT